MKTFETEKGNIPEGATHYRDECKDFTFVWVKQIAGKEYVWDADSWYEAVVINRDLEIKPIPQTNIETPEDTEVEWVNGELLEFKGEPCIFIGMSEGFPVVKYTHDADSALAGEIDEIFATDMLSKPETPQQREEREKLEAAYDLYCDFTNSNQEDATCVSMYGFEMSPVQYKWLAIVDKTNYRKEG